MTEYFEDDTDFVDAENDTAEPLQSRGSQYDRFGRRFISNPANAADLIENYASPVFRQHIDTAALQPAPTNYISENFKELILDTALVGRFLDKTNFMELLFALEFKSAVAFFSPIQLLAYASLVMYMSFVRANRPTRRGRFKPLIPVMVLIYCGPDDIDEEMWFQQIYDNLPEWLREYVPQFRIEVLNLRTCLKTGFRGKPTTRVWAEALVRGCEKKLAENLDQVLQHLSGVPLDDQICELVGQVIRLCAEKEGLSAVAADRAIFNVYQGEEGTHLSQSVKTGLYWDSFNEGVAQGVAQGVERGMERGALRSKVDAIVSVLKRRHRIADVPKTVMEQLQQRTDLIALESLLGDAVDCETLADFEKCL